MSWQMFIDDERFPVDENMIIARTVPEAIELIDNKGCPYHISFDHDLGENIPTGFDLAKWLVERDLDENGAFLPVDFSYYIHSQNPVGAKNIMGLLDKYLEHKEKTCDLATPQSSIVQAKNKF